MSTYMAKAGQVDRKWYVIDAAGKPLGRVAAQAAVLLRGKHKLTFTPRTLTAVTTSSSSTALRLSSPAVRLKRSIIIITRVIGHLKAVRYDTPDAHKAGKRRWSLLFTA